jgi:hypothetical protein
MKMEHNQDWWIVVLKEEIGGDWVTVLNLVPIRPYKQKREQKTKTKERETNVVSRSKEKSLVKPGALSQCHKTEE